MVPPWRKVLAAQADGLAHSTTQSLNDSLVAPGSSEQSSSAAVDRNRILTNLFIRVDTAIREALISRLCPDQDISARFFYGGMLNK